MADSKIKTLSDLLREMQVDTSKWRVKTFTVDKKDEIKGGQVHELFRVRATLESHPALELRPADTAAYPPVVPGLVSSVGSDVEVAAFIPDFQIGYEWTEDYSYLEPFHDRQAIDCMLQFLTDLSPDHVFILGDYLDLPEYSKFEKRYRGCRFKNTTQASLEEGYYYLRRIRDAVGWKCKIYFIHGNHDVRLNKELKTLNEELTWLKQAGGSEPIMSLAHLLRFNELGIEYNDDYDSPMWLWDQIQVRHGEEYTNLTAHKQTSYVVQGHCHDLVYDLKTVWGPQGPYCVGIMSPGCFSRLEGPIPKFSKLVDWQQGMGVAYKPADGPIHMQVMPIHNGRMFHGSKVYNAQNPSALAMQAARVTGIKQLTREA